MDVQDDQESTLSAADLASILKWSKDISSDINLSSGLSLNPSVVARLTGGLGIALQRLTEIAAGNSFTLASVSISDTNTETSGSQKTCGILHARP